MASPYEVNRIKQSVEEKFDELKSALMMREKLLLRQLDVINNTCKQQQLGTAVITSAEPSESSIANIQFICDNEKELLTAIRNFGRYHFININLALQQLYLKNEDYIEPADDHETMFKDLNGEELLKDVDGEVEEHKKSGSITIDFSHHKSIMAHSARRMNDSIVNITLKEAKELIRQAKTRQEILVSPLNLEKLDDGVEPSTVTDVSSLAKNSESTTGGMPDVNHKYSQTQQIAKKKGFKPKITINNCNGAINLRNIASLTINCTAEDNIKAQIPLTHHLPDLKLKPEINKEDESNILVESSSSNIMKTNITPNSKFTSESTMVTSSGSTECNSSKQTTVTTSTSDNTISASISNLSSNNSSRSQSKKQKFKPIYKNEKTTYGEECEEGFQDSSSTEITCEFYNRLLNEIKKTIQNPKGRTKYATTTKTANEQSSDSIANDNAHHHVPLEDYLNSEIPQRRRFILKNFENLKIILEAQNGGDDDTFHPVQIEQWLAEIIADTDLEPMQNTDILEHSKIHTKNQES
uniref:Uncharacterized protein n=1 Tax=Glossina brevipalpis TaxID=37001 RepID=A0A1A9WCZ2_9MUSC